MASIPSVSITGSLKSIVITSVEGINTDQSIAQQKANFEFNKLGIIPKKEEKLFYNNSTKEYRFVIYYETYSVEVLNSENKNRKVTPSLKESQTNRKEKNDKIKKQKTKELTTAIPPKIVENSTPKVKDAFVRFTNLLKTANDDIKSLIIPVITVALLEKLNIKPAVVNFVLKKDFSRNAVIKLGTDLEDISTPIDPFVVEEFFTGKINLKSLSSGERKRILVSLSPLIPLSCPPQSVIKEIIDTRNRLLTFLEKLGQTLQRVTQGLVIASVGLNLTSNILKVLRSIKISLLATQDALATSAPALPAPSVLTGTSAKTDNISNNIKFTFKGTPKLDKIEAGINSVAPYVAVASYTINLAVSLLRLLDLFLYKCAIEDNITPISNNLSSISNRQEQADNTLNQTSYQGFIIEIEEVPFSPTVIRKRAIGVNQSGIKLIETPLSFTTEPSLLVEELKFIIDRDNLKAY
jgi:hypothetical protein